MSQLIIIRGNSGSGKTTVAKALQHRLGHNVMLLSQDAIRRDLLRVKDGPDTKALPLLCEMLRYGQTHCEVIILEGILHSDWYAPLFELARELFPNRILAYYYDLSFEETLARHASKENSSEFGAREMREWWQEKDFMDVIPETVIPARLSKDDTVEMILEQLSRYAHTQQDES